MSSREPVKVKYLAAFCIWLDISFLQGCSELLHRFALADEIFEIVDVQEEKGK